MIQSNDLLSNDINFLFIHRKTKKFLHVDIKPKGDKVDVDVLGSDDGLSKPQPVEKNAVIESIPKLPGNVLLASAIVVKHFKKNGYKMVDTMTQTKKGVKLS